MIDMSSLKPGDKVRLRSGAIMYLHGKSLLDNRSYHLGKHPEYDVDVTVYVNGKKFNENDPVERELDVVGIV